MPKLYSIEQLAEDAGCSTRTIERLIKSGVIEVAERFGTTRRFDDTARRLAMYSQKGYPDKLDATEAAAFLGVTRERFYQLRDQHNIQPAVELSPRQIWYHKRDIVPLLDRKPGRPWDKERGK